MFGDYAACLSILTNYQTLESYISGSLEKSVWEGALLSPILPQRMDSICVWAESVIGEDPAWSQAGLGSSPAPHSQDL